ncbi:hypothetical protein [Intrasporangium mesophilum]
MGEADERPGAAGDQGPYSSTRADVDGSVVAPVPVAATSHGGCRPPSPCATSAAKHQTGIGRNQADRDPRSAGRAGAGDPHGADRSRHRLHRTPEGHPEGEPTDRTHARIRHDRVDKVGKVTLRRGGTLLSIALGRTWTGTEVTMTIHGLNVHVTTRKGRQVIRELTIDPARRHQPLKAKLPEP